MEISQQRKNTYSIEIKLRAKEREESIDEYADK
jgi:hypothetical protein